MFNVEISNASFRRISITSPFRNCSVSGHAPVHDCVKIDEVVQVGNVFLYLIST